MSELFFTLKSFILSCGLVIFLQVSWKEQSLEDRLWIWLRNSPVTVSFRETKLDIIWSDIDGSFSNFLKNLGFTPSSKKPMEILEDIKDSQ